MRGSLFSAKAEYACIAMLELAARHGDPTPVRLKAIADAHGIPKRFLVQILLQLKGAGLVASTRGASGGYHLARAPQTITLGDVIGVIDRSENPAELRSGNGAPPSPLARAIHGVWNDILDAQQRLLEATTLADLLQRAQSAYDLAYQI
jgi:Rrf2 family cysteine metabolism transcriptional repressor